MKDNSKKPTIETLLDIVSETIDNELDDNKARDSYQFSWVGKFMVALAEVAFVLALLSGFVYLLCEAEYKSKMRDLARDGFRVEKEYSTYTLVEKDGCEYMATKDYHSGWRYEHYPKCKLHNKK